MKYLKVTLASAIALGATLAWLAKRTAAETHNDAFVAKGTVKIELIPRHYLIATSEFDYENAPSFEEMESVWLGKIALLIQRNPREALAFFQRAPRRLLNKHFGFEQTIVKAGLDREGPEFLYYSIREGANTEIIAAAMLQLNPDNFHQTITSLMQKEIDGDVVVATLLARCYRRAGTLDKPAIHARLFSFISQPENQQELSAFMIGLRTADPYLGAQLYQEMPSRAAAAFLASSNTFSSDLAANISKLYAALSESAGRSERAFVLNNFGANLWNIDKGMDTLLNFCATADAADARGAMDSWIAAGGTDDILRPLKALVGARIEPVSIALWQQIATNLEQRKTTIDLEALRAIISSRQYSDNELELIPAFLKNLTPSLHSTEHK